MFQAGYIVLAIIYRMVFTVLLQYQFLHLKPLWQP